MNTAEAATPVKPTYKPRDVEETLDIWIFRPVAQRVVAVLAGTPLTPNQVTVLSGFVGILAGLVLTLTMSYSHWWAVLGAVIGFSCVVLDCSDGQLARLRGESTIAGRGLDGAIDPLFPIAFFHGMAFFLLAHGVPYWYVFGVGWATGISMVVHTNNYDLAKNAYLHNAQDPALWAGRHLLAPEEIEAERQQHLKDGRKALAFFLWIFVHYTANQRKRGNTAIERDEPITRTTAERVLYRSIFLRHIRLWTLMGLSTHNTVLIVTALLIPVAPWVVHVGWFIILVPGNALFFYLTTSKHRLIAEYERRVEELR